MTLLVFYNYYSHPLLYFLRMFIVFLHESSHALAALLTGAEISEFNMDPREGGHVLFRGGTFWIVAMSGYLGSLIWGILLLFFSCLTKQDRWILFMLSAWTLFFSAAFFSNTYTLIFGIVSSGVLFGIFLINKHTLCDLTLKIIGLFSVVYVPYDIYSDTISRSHLKSDAFYMAEAIGLTTSIWGWIWLVLSICVILAGLYWTIKSTYLISSKGEFSTE